MRRLVILACLLLPLGARAQLYRCEADGAVTYRQEPCAGGREIPVPPSPTPADRERARVEIAIARNEVFVGMLARDVRRSWGEPTRVNRSTSAEGTREQWVYRRSRRGHDQYLYLFNGVLESTQSLGVRE